MQKKSKKTLTMGKCSSFVVFFCLLSKKTKNVKKKQKLKHVFELKKFKKLNFGKCSWPWNLAIKCSLMQNDGFWCPSVTTFLKGSTPFFQLHGFSWYLSMWLKKHVSREKYFWNFADVHFWVVLAEIFVPFFSTTLLRKTSTHEKICKSESNTLRL